MKKGIPSTIHENEGLYRGIPIQNWDLKNNRILSSAFKDKDGCSVDRSHDRNESDCVKALKRFPRICRVVAGKVSSNNMIAKYCPTTNKYHSEIHQSNGEKELTSSQQRYLCKCAEIVKK